MSGQEILTIQFGPYANHVGGHYFNIQEAGFSYNPSFVPEIDNDILFRESRSGNGTSSYTPRLLLVDSISSIGPDVSLTGEAFAQLPNEEEILKTIGSNVDIIQHEPHSRNDDKNEFISYQDLGDGVKFWSDYSSVSFNHRTYHILDSLTLPKDVMNEGLYSLGKDIWEKAEFEESFVDDIQYHLEDCDNLQGFHVLVDAQSLFSGISSGCLQHLKDEFNKKSILTCPLMYSKESDCFAERLNLNHTFSKCYELSDIVVPLSTDVDPFHRVKREFPLLDFNDSLFHTSSVVALGLEMITTPYRSRQRLTRLDHLVNHICVYNRKVVSTAVNTPWELNDSNYLYDELMNWKGEFTPLTPLLHGDDSLLDLQFVSSKFNISSMIRDSDKKMLQEINPTLGLSNPKDVLEYFFYTQLGGMKTVAACINEKFRLPRNFPDIFKPSTGSYKAQTKGPDGAFYGKLRDMEAIASLQQTREMVNLLREIKPDENFVKKSVPRLKRMGLRLMDLEAEVEDLSNLISSYEPAEFL